MSDAALRLLRAQLGWWAEPIIGGLPDDPVLDVPLIAGSEIVGSIVHREPPMVIVYIDANSPVTEIRAFYDREYGERGWHAQVPNRQRMGGFGFHGSRGAPGSELMPRVFCKSETEPYYQLAVSDQEPRIRVSWHGTAEGMVHPCSSDPVEDRMHGPPADAMPMLEGPPEMPISGGGGGGGPNEWSTYGSAMTDMPAVELMDHFVASIAEQGHELIERASAERVATSRWRLKKKGWEGLLVIAEQRKDLRHLLFLTYSDAAHANLRRSGHWSQYGVSRLSS